MGNKFVLDYTSWLNESFFTNKAGRHNIKMFMSTKLDNWEDLWKRRKLTFANNSGNMYGIGVYANLEMPEESEIGYSEEQRKRMYGENIYEMELKSDEVFYFSYDYFTGSKLYDLLENPSKDYYIGAQFDYFKIPYPDKEKDKFTMSDFSPEKVEDKNGVYYFNEGKCAYKFYKYMSSKYPQREDGTLDAPIDGIVYKGRKDGKSISIWNPYNLRIIRKKIGDGKWENIDARVIVYTEEENKKNKQDMIDTVYDGNKTFDKEEVYKDLMLYRGKNVPLGQFINVVIHDDKAVDATFKSNIPMEDGGRHAFPATKNQFIYRIVSRGFYLDKVECWIKFGVSDSKEVDKLIDPSVFAKQYVPREITGGIILSNYRNGISNHITSLLKMDIKSNDKLVLNSCNVDTIEFGNYVIDEMNYCVIEDKLWDHLSDKAKRGKDGVVTSIKKSQEDELKEYVKENDTMSKEKKAEWAKKFGMSEETFTKVYNHLDSLKEIRKNK